jgi:hypothetical protein
MATLPHLVVILLLSIKTVHTMSIQEKPSVLGQSIATRIVPSNVEASAFAVAVKIDTTTT